MTWLRDIFSGLMIPATKYIEDRNKVKEIEG